MAKLALSFSFSSLYHSKQKLSVMGDSFLAFNNEKLYPPSMQKQAFLSDDTTSSKKSLLV